MKSIIISIFVLGLCGCSSLDEGTIYLLNQRIATVESRKNLAEEEKKLNYITIWIENSNQSQTPVKIEQIQGNYFRGPKGEYYRSFPTELQLRKVYGF